jgi:Uma2 family endonuclease
LEAEIIYPESDGLPMADNTKQFNLIVAIKEGLEALFATVLDVFVAGDLFWYPVEGNNKIRQAPDVLVAFGRPKGHRGSYMQWKEDGIAPQVVFEVMSPSNTKTEMERKFQFYQRYGVAEYYKYDPDRGELEGWLRKGAYLEPIKEMEGWESPWLGIRFELDGTELVLYRPDGEQFLTYQELMEQREEARQWAETERRRAETERRRAETERQRAEQAEQRAQRMAEQLRALGIEPADE